MRCRFVRTAIPLFVCVVGAVLPSRAAALLADAFNYTNGALVSVSGGAWIHHSGNVTGEVQVVSSRVRLNGNDTEDVSALLSGGPYDPAGPTNRFYVSITVRFTSLPGASGTYFAMFKDASATGFRARLWALSGGAAPGKFRLGISSTSSSICTVNPADLSLDTDYRVVARLVSSNSAAKFWINPGAESDPFIASSDSGSAFAAMAYAFRQSSGEGALSIDDLRVGTSFPDVVTNAPPLRAPEILSAPRHQSAVEGSTAVFGVTADGLPAPGFQWQFNGTNLPGAVDATLTLTNVTFAQAGFYTVLVTNVIDSTASEPAVLNVFSGAAPAFSLVTYNLHGNGALNWSTNSSHVKAIGRQVQYLDPDILTFQEVPITNNGTAQMTNFVAAFRPGFHLATNSADDGYIRSVILSRFPITSSTSRLHGADLAPFGYNGSGFTRDLFEAQMAIPDFPRPLHVFTAHLKSGQDPDAQAKRSAEAGAISNYFATAYLSSNGLDPYILTGDMNEDLLRLTGDSSALERLISAPVGLWLTTPFNPTNGSELTFSIQSTSLTRRYDYILPSGLLFSNAVSGEVFRTDLLSPVPPGLNSGDDVTASDHLPVFMRFANPYTRPFRLLSIPGNNQQLLLVWESVIGQGYRVESSSNLIDWTTFRSNVVATGSMSTMGATATGGVRFFRVRRAP